MNLLVIDPLKKFPGVPSKRIMEAMGILPHWVDPDDPRSAKEQFEEKYQFGCYPMSGTVDKDGTYRYPEDPPLHPIAMMARDTEKVYFYLHAMVAVVPNEGDTFVTRMD